jgi:hypothetical protein
MSGMDLKVAVGDPVLHPAASREDRTAMTIIREMFLANMALSKK